MMIMIGSGHYGEVPLLEVSLCYENYTDFIIFVSRIEWRYSHAVKKQKDTENKYQVKIAFFGILI